MIAALSTDPTWLQHFMCDFMCAQLLKVRPTPFTLRVFGQERKFECKQNVAFLISKHETESTPEMSLL